MTAPTRCVRLRRFATRSAVIWCLIGFGALAVRVGYVLIVKSGPCPLVVNGVVVAHYNSECTGSNDQVNYNTTANRLALGGGFTSIDTPTKPLAEHPPMTTVVLGAVSFAFDHPPLMWAADETRMPLGNVVRTHVREHRLFMALLGTLNVLLIGRVLLQLTRKRGAFIGAAIAAVYPFLWVNDGLIMSETIAITLVLLLLDATLAEVRAPTARRRWYIGALCGLLALTRAELLLLAPLTALVVTRRPFTAAARRAVPIAGACILVMTPWTLFNLSRFERPVFTSTNDGLTFAGSNCEPAYNGATIGLWIPAPPCLMTDEELDAFADSDASVIAQEYRQRGTEYLRAHIERLPIVASARVARLWNAYRPFDMVSYNEGEARGRTVTTAGIWSFYALGIAAISGGISTWRRRRRALAAVLAPAVAVTCSAAVLVGQTRMRAPAEPALVVLAAVGIEAAIRSARLRAPRQS